MMMGFVELVVFLKWMDGNRFLGIKLEG